MLPRGNSTSPLPLCGSTVVCSGPSLLHNLNGEGRVNEILIKAEATCWDSQGLLPQSEQLDPGYFHSGRYRDTLSRGKECKRARAGERSEVQWRLCGEGGVGRRRRWGADGNVYAHFCSVYLSAHALAALVGERLLSIYLDFFSVVMVSFRITWRMGESS